MRYKIGDLQIFATPKAEQMFQFQGLPDISFEFPVLVNTVLFVHCGLVHASLHGAEDHYEVIGRLYSTYHPNQNEENHIGKLYVHIYGYPKLMRFEKLVEQIQWNADGTFEVVRPDIKKE